MVWRTNGEDDERATRIAGDLNAASLDDLLWLAARATHQLYRDVPEAEEAERFREGRMWEIDRENTRLLLALVQQVAQVKAEVVAAKLVADTNTELVGETQGLVAWTKWLAGATIVLAVVAVATLFWTVFNV